MPACHWWAQLSWVCEQSKAAPALPHNRDKTELIRYPSPPSCLTDSKPPIEAGEWKGAILHVATIVAANRFSCSANPIIVCVSDENPKRIWKDLPILRQPKWNEKKSENHNALAIFTIITRPNHTGSLNVCFSISLLNHNLRWLRWQAVGNIPFAAVLIGPAPRGKALTPYNSAYNAVWVHLTGGFGLVPLAGLLPTRIATSGHYCPPN